MVDQVSFTDIYVDETIVDRTSEVLRSKRYVKGDELAAFEEQFADECGTRHAVGVSNGTAAILLGLQALGVEEGDQIFIPGETFFATVSPVLSLGAKPIFVDIDPETYIMDPTDLRQKVEEARGPSVVLPVHIYGQLADMEAILDLAAEYDLDVLEDSCQAHFAERDGYVAGAAGDVGAFSFYPSKNMTVGGDGGMLVTDDGEVAKKARALRNHGRDNTGRHRELGLNHRLNEVNAVIGQEQLRHVREWNRNRNEAAQRYTERLSDVSAVTTPTEAAETLHVYHLYVVQVEDRPGLREHLQERDIETGIHYGTPAHKHDAVVERVGETTLQVTEDISPRILSLPMHPRITTEEIDTVCESIEEYYG